MALEGLGRPVAAINALQMALELRPVDLDVAMRLAKLLGDMGRQETASALLHLLAAKHPDDPSLRGFLLYGLHHSRGDDGPLMLREHRAWCARHADPLRGEIRPHGNDRSPHRRLKVAYVSADFRDHPASRFLLPLLEAHDHGQIELFLYNDTEQAHPLMDRFKATADVWRDTGSLYDHHLAERIRADGIDILIDPTGFMALNRILTFARKPAPVQMAYFGYPGSTGLATIDWRITDPLLDPSGLTETHYTERLIRIDPSAMVYHPLSVTDDVRPTPAMASGFIRFGALNRLSKVTPLTIRLWARVLAAVPNSRLLLLSPTTQEKEADDEIRHLFARHGVPAERLELAPRSPRESYLKLFHHIDIHLDTFPYNGCTTTCDGLWMGVPTVTLAGRPYASRMGVSLLTQMGLTDCIASSPDGYVRICERLSADAHKLNARRLLLRPSMLRSPLMDYRRMARNVERAFRHAWRVWCQA